MSNPAIGITLDWEPAGGWAKQPWYAVRENYCATIAAAGGLPLPLPHHLSLVDGYLDQIGGLLITGGDFDIDPALFGATEIHETVTTKQRRTAFELAMVRGALDRDLAVLGICGGEQLLQVALGGALIQHIPDAIANALAHEQPNPRTEAGHTVAVVADTLLARIAGTDVFPVNSAHHQAAADAPAGVVIGGRAPDGVIEAIEVPAKRFCLGVQWHPEYHISPVDTRVLEAFVDAART